MPSLPSRALRRSARDPLFLFFLVTVVLCLLRSRFLPTFEVSGAAVGFPDVALLVLAAFTARRLRGAGRSLPSPWLVAAAAAFAALIVVSSLGNGGTAFTSAARLAELFVLTFAAAVLIDSKERFEALAIVVLGFCVAAAAWAMVQFVDHGPGRQPSFLGEHDLAALGTMTIVIGLAALYARRGRPDSLTLIALIAGSVAVTLGAALASLVGLYLAAGAVVALAIARHDLRRAPLFATILVVVAISAATLTLRSGDLGFLKSWFGPEPDTPGQYAASWSQRLIFAYIGGRVFFDHPLLGTGWYGELPATEYARYLPDAHARFPDQPPHYFPTEDGTFIPQQTYDQMLYELGIVGFALLLVLLAVAMRKAVAAALQWPRGPASELAYLPAAWLAAIVGALAGAALFGGTPIAGMFWLTLGVVAAAGSLVPAASK
jgi:hypothetical protein